MLFWASRAEIKTASYLSEDDIVLVGRADNL
jgi:hypothetical protein